MPLEIFCTNKKITTNYNLVVNIFFNYHPRNIRQGYLLGEDRAQEIEPPQVEAYFAQNHNIDSTNTLWPL